MSIFQVLILQPLYNLLALLSNFTHGDLGLAVLIFAAIIRLAIWPWYKKAMGDQQKIAKLQPKIQAIQKKFKDDPIQANEEVLKAFREEKVNAGGSILFFVFQIALFFCLYAFFREAIVSDWTPYLYKFVALPSSLNYLFLGMIDLKIPSLILAIVSASLNSLLTFIQPSSGQNKAMLLGFPFIILLFYKNFPAIIILYWIGMTLVNVAQEIISKRNNALVGAPESAKN